MESRPKFQGASRALGSRNLIREVVQDLKLPENFHKPTYNLGLGDPSKYEGFEPHPKVNEITQEIMQQNIGNGYTDSRGDANVRKFLAEQYSTPDHQLGIDDVILDIGGCGTIHTILSSVLNPGENFLFPRPGFPLFFAYAHYLGCEGRTYDLDPNNNWEVDMQKLEQVVDENTKLIVIINPSNPCGTIWRREHCVEIVDFCRRKNIIILADEVYQGMSYGKEHISFKEVCDDVPTLLISSLSKRYLIPGWRMGWIAIYDKLNLLEEIRDAILRIKNLLLHPVTFMQFAIPRIFQEVPAEWHRELMQKVKQKAELIFRRVESIPALSMSAPEGALYCLINLDTSRLREIDSSAEFIHRLVNEEGVLTMPGESFMVEKSFRIVLCSNEQVLSECMDRIEALIRRYLIEDNSQQYFSQKSRFGKNVLIKLSPVISAKQVHSTLKSVVNFLVLSRCFLLFCLFSRRRLSAGSSATRCRAHALKLLGSLPRDLVQ